MAPVGLTLKKSHDKYAQDPQGELMLIYRCTACGALSTNRIVADDDPVAILEAFKQGALRTVELQQQCLEGDIQLLLEKDRFKVEICLYGSPVPM